MAESDPPHTAAPAERKGAIASVADAEPDAGGTWLRLPAGTPEPVRAAICLIAANNPGGLPADHIAILGRLVTDRRLQGVCAELMCRDRRTGAYLHPARPHPSDPPLKSDRAQAYAIMDLVRFAFRAAADGVRVSKLAEIEAAAARLRELAADLRALAADPANAAEAEALRAVADRHESTIETFRKHDDPLTIKNERGNPRLRGLTIVLAAHMRDRFGESLEGTCAKLAAIALGVEVQHRRAARSAFSAPKQPKEADC